MATYRSVVTFEADKGDPVVVRAEIVDSGPDSAARRAVFRALPHASRTKYSSVVIVLDVVNTAAPKPCAALTLEPASALVGA